MGLWDNVPEHVRRSTGDFLAKVRTQAQEFGDASMRHLERQDLLRERRQIAGRLGEHVLNRLVVEERKTLRADSSDIEPLVERVREIDSRLGELDEADREKPPRDG